ncbi:MAG TPA: hypothetical protein VJX67_24035 [Blastocatellia bacterium]|nr:hypothetical protein [Blastocatellia bacterium]
MAHKEIGKLTLTVEPEALRTIISSGRLLEFVETAGKQAAAQIASQLVQQVGEAAVSARELKTGASVGFAYVAFDGDPGFGNVPHLPHVPRPGVLQQFAE